MREIKGTVRRIIYANEDSRFYVFTVEDVGDGMKVKKVRGNLPVHTPYAGQEVVITGRWEDTTYGPTLQLETFEPGQIVSNEGLRKYLVSNVRGIGEVSAKRIVDYFGDETLNVLEREPERLEEVPNLNAAQRNSLVEEWREYSDYRRVAVHLLELDLPHNIVKRIYDAWGSETMERIDADPYRLVEIKGVGFVMADRVAMSRGIPLDSPLRVGACILYALQKASMGPGHLYIEGSQLMNHVYGLVHRDEIVDFGRPLKADDVREVLRRLRDEERIVIEGDAVYLAGNHYYEEQTAAMLAKYVGPQTLMEIDPEAFIARYEEEQGIVLSEKQREAVTVLGSRRTLLITGLPGTGKTTVCRAVVQLFKEQGLRYKLMSPTGIAAKRLATAVGDEAYTIHRALGYKGESWHFGAQNQLPVDAVLVDEMSMVSQHVMYRLLSAVPEEAVLVLVGDDAQLPSVGAGNVLHEMTKVEEIPRVHLSQIYRQEEASDIILNAHRINEGQKPVLSEKRDFNFLQMNSASDIVRGIVGLVEKIQEKAGSDTTFQVLSPRWGGPLGVDNLNKEIREALNPLQGQRERGFKGGMRLREGDRVIITSNDYQLGVYNGEIGTVTEIDTRNSEVKVMVRDGNKTKMVPIGFETVPELLDLAFCITIHKSQGLGYDFIVMPFVDSFTIQLQRNLLYTAITRAAKRVFILGEWSAITKAVGNNKSIYRNTRLSERVVLHLGGNEEVEPLA